jgi:hypothetical protein
MIAFDILSRFCGEVRFTAQIDCADDAPLSTKRRLAVMWAIENKANLTGANLTWADLTRADLTGANLTGADLIAGASRSDGYRFMLVRNADQRLTLQAGCRRFTLQEAREHWAKTRGGTPLGDETFAIIDHLERVARIRGWIGEVAQ